MDEYIELLDANSNPTGEKCLKSIAHKKGYYHASVHIWFFTKHKEILLQKRIETKDTFPGLWDVSVAGHIAFGEQPLQAAVREVQEEIGLTILTKKLHSIGTSTHKNTHSVNLIDHELHYLYIALLNTGITNLTIQKEEVSEIKLITMETFKKELIENSKKYVPHGSDYYARIFKAIEQYA